MDPRHDIDNLQDTSVSGDQPDSTSQNPASRGFSINCPVCHEPISAGATDDWVAVECEFCGNRFGLLDDALPGDNLQPGASVGRFTLEEPIGQGGFGAVWRAYDPHLERRVALKIPRRSDLTSAEGEAFLREARAAAQVQHPHIVAIHEVGRDGDRIYLVSDLIQGDSLAERLEISPPTIGRAMRWCESLARALHAVHEAGVVHRDLKPANILLDQTDTPYLVDFGLARRENNELTLTSEGQVMGTRAYLSPEQARGDSHSADRRSDIFSFGSIIYELLTGELPFRGKHHAALQAILKDEPVRPRRLNPLIPRDLETICLKCLEKDPKARFATAQELADELERFRHQQPIRSRPLGWTQHAVRWTVRRPFRAALAILLMLLAIGGPLVAVHQGKLKGLAETAQLAAQNNAELAAQNALRARRQAYAADMNNVQRALDDADPGSARQLLEQHFPEPGQEDVRGFVWRHFWKRCHLGLIETIQLGRPIDAIAVSDDQRFAAISENAHEVSRFRLVDLQTAEIIRDESRVTNAVSGITFEKSGNRIYAVDRRGDLVWWAGVHPCEPKRVKAHNEAFAMKRSPTAPEILTAGDDGTIKIWSLTPDKPLRTIDLGEMRCRTMAISRDGKSLAVAGISPTHHSHSEFVVIDLETGEPVWRRKQLDGWSESGIAFSPDGETLATMGHNGGGAPRMWNAMTGEPSEPLEEISHPCNSWIGFSPHGEYLAAFKQSSGNVYLWDARTRRRLDFALPHPRVKCASWIDNTTLVTGGLDGCLRRWKIGRDASARKSIAGVRGNMLWHATSSPDGNSLATLSNRDVVQLWDTLKDRLRYTFPGKYVGAPFLLPNGTVLIKNTERTLLYRHEVDQPQGEVLYDPGDPLSQPRVYAVSPNGNWLAIGEGVNQDATPDEIGLMVCDLRTEDRFRFPTKPYVVLKLAFSKDSSRVFTIDSGHQFRVWSILERSQLSEIPDVYHESVTAMGLHPMETMFAVGDDSGLLNVFSINTGERIHSFPGFGKSVRQIKFTRDGRTLMAALGNYKGGKDARGEIRVWDLNNGQSVARLGRKLRPCIGLALTADELQMTTTHFDGKIFVWKGASDEEVARQRSRGR